MIQELLTIAVSLALGGVAGWWLGRRALLRATLGRLLRAVEAVAGTGREPAPMRLPQRLVNGVWHEVTAEVTGVELQ